jgi:hypothetical protein
MSMDASGTVANAITFSRWRGRQYVRRHVVPSNPSTSFQVGIRAMLAVLANQWASIGLSFQASWAHPAALVNLLPFHAYIRDNMRRWRDNRGVSQSYPPPETLTPELPVLTATGHERYALLGLDASGYAGTWLFTLHRELGVIAAPTYANCVKILPSNFGFPLSFVDSPLAKGTYHYMAASITSDGLFGSPTADTTAVVT